MAAKDKEAPESAEAGSDDLTDDMTDDDLTAVTDLTYEQARDELISIVAQLEGGQIGLEESMTLWQRGEALASHCNTWLDGAEAKLTTGSRSARATGQH